MAAAEAWFRDEVISGIQRLSLLALEGEPAGELLRGTVLGWVECLWPDRAWLEDRDVPRLRAAFLALSRQVRRWPPPRALLDALPPAPEQRKLPRAVVTRESAEANRKHIDAAVAALTRSHT